MNFIKELYFGNLSPGEQSVIRNSEYSRLLGLSDKLAEEIKQNLSEEACRKLEELCGANLDLIGITAEENYVFGFRDGARLMLDILAGENRNLQHL